MITKEKVLKEFGLTEEQWKAKPRAEQDKMILRLQQCWRRGENYTKGGQSHE